MYQDQAAAQWLDGKNALAEKNCQEPSRNGSGSRSGSNVGPFLLCKLNGQRQYGNQQEVYVDTYKIRDGANGAGPGHGGWFAVAGSALAAATIQWLDIHPGRAAPVDWQICLRLYSQQHFTIGPAADLTPFYCNCRVFKQLRSQARFGLFP